MSLLISTETEPFNLNLLQKSISTKKNSSCIDDPASVKKSHEAFAAVDLNIDADLRQAIQKAAYDNKVEFNSFLITAANIILQRYTGQPNVLLGQAFVQLEANNAQVAELWNELNSSDLLTDTLLKVNAAITVNADFTNLPASLQLSGAGINKDLFQVFFISDKGLEDNSSTLIREFVSQLNDFYFGIYLKGDENSQLISIFYDINKFNAQFFDVFITRLLALLRETSSYPSLKLGEFNVLGKDEYDLLINKFNDTITAYPHTKTIFDLFEQQAAEKPGAVALIKGSKQLTYHQLNKQANQLAHYLINEGVKPGDNIGLLTNRSFDMIIGMLGILKAGGAYVPIDPDYPLDRQEYIYTQSAIKMIVADHDYPLKVIVKENNFKLINQLCIENFDEHNPALKIDSSQLAYTIYTSGSTGKPKGVMIAHHSAVNLLQWVNNRFNITNSDKLLFITSMCFDLSVYDIFGMLSAGAAVVIAEKTEIQNVQVLAEMLIKHQITFWDSVPTTLDYLVKTLEKDNPKYRYAGLKTVFMSGDWIPVNLPDRIKLFFPEVQVVSLGGATEGTVWSNYFVVDKTDPAWSSIPYGKPIANNFFYILNDHLQPVPVGTVGDLYIGGVGVAKGYANDSEKTARSFIPDPFHPGSGGMMYRTGDSGKMMPDYNMEFIGRKDNQVKIQGFRVELGEIESVLNGSGLVNAAIVLAKPDSDGNKRLVAYIVSKTNGHDPESFKSYLHKFLPEYMIPSVWIELDNLPLTGNGKIDRNALPEVNDVAKIKREYVEPETETERVLVSIWKENFRNNDIDVLSNFFDIGGHSLMAVQILSKLKNHREKPAVISFYKYPSVRLLAHFIDEENDDYNFRSLVAIKPSGSKNPLYIIHGDGLNVLNFSKLANHMGKDQPVYGLQALGLNGVDEPIDKLPVIAYHYMQEIIKHNPRGPYLLAGYSSGGYVAMEIRKQMVAQGREVKMLIIFDTDAEKTEYKDWYSLLPKKAKRHFPRMLQAIKFSISQTFKGKSSLQPEVPVEKKKDSKEFYRLIQKIKNKHITAFRNYPLEPFDGKLYLYRAKISVHYVEYGKYLGWEKFAEKGVDLFEIPGDHFSMLQTPHVAELADILQKNIDNVALG